MNITDDTKLLLRMILRAEEKLAGLLASSDRSPFRDAAATALRIDIAAMKAQVFDALRAQIEAAAK